MKKRVQTNHLRNMPSRDRSSSAGKDVSALNLSSGYMRKSEYSIGETNDYLAVNDSRDIYNKRQNSSSTKKKIKTSSNKRLKKNRSS